MLDNLQIDEIKKLHQQGKKAKEICKITGWDKNTVYKYIKEEEEDDEEEKSPDAIQIPEEVLEEAEKIIRKRNKKEITDEFWENTCLPYVENNFIPKDEHLQEINSIEDKYGEQTASLKSEYSRQVDELNNTIQQFNNTIQQLNEEKQDLQNYINNELDEAGRKEKNECLKQRRFLKEERKSFDSFMKHKRKDLVDMYKKLDEQETRLNKQKKELDIQEKELNEQEKQIKIEGQEQQQALRELQEEKAEVQLKSEKLKKEWADLKQKREELNITTKELHDIRIADSLNRK